MRTEPGANMLEKLKATALGFLNSQDHTAEINLGAYAFGVTAAAAWLTWWFYTGPRDANLVAAFAAFLGAVTGGLFKRGSSATPAGTPNKEGDQQ